MVYELNYTQVYTGSHSKVENLKIWMHYLKRGLIFVKNVLERSYFRTYSLKMQQNIPFVLLRVWKYKKIRLKMKIFSNKIIQKNYVYMHS